ncbi:MAG: DNA mismatch repair endonuclease MutL [Lachnospiraceae bacterium]|nr:DNA mismatch repair endonuclease MutL [Lachnospiraceae bacterium]
MINILDVETINRIAAGEVIERPSSVVKELVENAIDASSSTITVEIKGGGSELIRITDNGCGININEVKTAFLPHATSKLKDASDLFTISTLGFRGEALPSIASVSDTEIITKEKDALLGARYEPGRSDNVTQVGAPDGTTIIVKDIFSKIPARKKFLKSATTETAYITDVIEKIAIANPGISFRLISNGRSVFFSNGNGSIKDIIYSMYGREMSESLTPVISQDGPLKVSGFIAKPIVARANRSDEYYYVNGRYIRNKTVTKAIEDAYAPFLMQHKFPFTVLFLEIDKELVDINVHPAKLEVRFKDSVDIYDIVYHTVKKTLENIQIVPKALEEPAYKPFKSAYEPSDVSASILSSDTRPSQDSPVLARYAPQEGTQQERYAPQEAHSVQKNQYMPLPNVYDDEKDTEDNKRNDNDEGGSFLKTSGIELSTSKQKLTIEEKGFFKENSFASPGRDGQTLYKNAPQFSLNTDTGDIEEETKESFKNSLNADYNIIGQVFDTYWLISHGDEAFFIDQHAAHEKIMYEKFMSMAAEEICNPQALMPGICVSLNVKEIECLDSNMDKFRELGFEIEPYGGREYLLTAVPLQDHGIDPKNLFLELLNDMLDKTFDKEKTLSLREQLATRACKAAIKGNSKISYEEAKALIEQLIRAKDPFNCPHGRPIFISITKDEMEKLFKRIV